MSWTTYVWNEEEYRASIPDSDLPEIVIDIDSLSIGDQVNEFTSPSFNPGLYVDSAGDRSTGNTTNNDHSNDSSESDSQMAAASAEHQEYDQDISGNETGFPSHTFDRFKTERPRRPDKPKRINTVRISAENRARMNTALGMTDAYIDSHPAFDDISDYLEVIRLKNMHGYCDKRSNIVKTIPFNEFVDNIDDQYPKVAQASRPIIQNIVTCSEVERCIIEDDIPDEALDDLAREKLKYYDSKEPTLEELEARQDIDSIPNLDEALKYTTTCEYQSSSTGRFTPEELNSLLNTRVGENGHLIFAPPGLGKTTFCNANFPTVIEANSLPRGLRTYRNINSLTRLGYTVVTNEARFITSKRAVIVVPTYGRFITNMYCRSFRSIDRIIYQYNMLLRLVKAGFPSLLLRDGVYLADVMVSR